MGYFVAVLPRAHKSKRTPESPHIYIHIYIERERERERGIEIMCTHAGTHARTPTHLRAYLQTIMADTYPHLQFTNTNIQRPDLFRIQLRILSSNPLPPCFTLLQYLYCDQQSLHGYCFSLLSKPSVDGSTCFDTGVRKYDISFLHLSLA